MSKAEDRAIELIRQCHNRIAAFAREAFAQCGRGLIVLNFIEMNTRIEVQPEFIEANDYKRVARNRPGGVEAAAEIIQMLDDYDPTSHAVVFVTYGKVTASGLVRLGARTLISGPTRVQ